MLAMGQSNSENYKAPHNGSLGSAAISSSQSGTHVVVNNPYATQALMSISYKSYPGILGFAPMVDSVTSVPFGNNLSVVEVMGYPNPFANKITFSFTIPKPSVVWLGIYNTNGQLVKTIAQAELQQQGNHQVPIDFSDLPNGNYIIQLKTPKHSQALQIVKSGQ